MTALLALGDLSPDPVERTEIPLGEWLPDLPSLNNPGALEALNVIPTEGGYIPWAGHTPDANKKMSGPVHGAFSILDDSDFVQLFAGSTKGVYTSLHGASNFTQIFAASVTAKNNWKFIHMNGVVVAIHPQVVPHYTPANSTANMLVVGGSPPKAECGAQVTDFLMLGNLKADPDDGNGFFPYRIRWSGFNDISSPWVSDPITQADFQDMPESGGVVRAISGRNYGTIFQERTISRATYRGPPTVFDIVQVEDRRGCIARDSIVDVGAIQFGLAEDGFFAWNGTNTQLIGANKINRYFFNRLQYNLRSRVSGAADFVNGCVHWAFPTDSTGQLNEIITYSYKEDRWSHTQLSLEFLFESAGTSVNLDQLSQPLENYGGSVDDQVYNQSGRGRVAAFNLNSQYGLFDGSPLSVIVDSSEFTAPNGRRIFINNVRPLVDLPTPSATVQIAYRDQLLGEVIQFSDEVAQEIDGQCPIIADARYMRFRCNIPAQLFWRHVTGFEIARKPTGVF